MKKKIIIILLIVVIILIGILTALYFINHQNKQEIDEAIADETLVVELEEEKEPEIFKGNDRPIAVMIDNVGDARPQAGLNDAYLVYEIIVEGSQTRLMALFKGVNLSKIGPIRSSRHYYLDYALENDAIYVHYGWSPQAQSDITKLSVNNINGITESSSSFWRVKDKSAPHNVVTTTDKILEIAERKGYATTSTKESVLNYVTDEVELADGTDALDISIPYSTSYKVNYKYDAETKRYTRSYNSTTQKDWTTGNIVTTKNIIITYAQNTKLNDGENKDRQNLSNVGDLDGYYITNGKAIPIKCYKASRREQTVYKDLLGNEINVNDGNTFIQIVPIDADVTFGV